MGLLEKTNAKATLWSVVRSAAMSAGVGAIVYGLVIYLRAEPTEYWQLKLAIWSLGCLLVGALGEWQGGCQ